ncbi:MAG: NADP-dependent oxidoreductase [Bacteroidetes bacterium]|nr:NADP-dependent oxidoreductase [Bacteroidota bacterium]MDA1121759.1 NADP-dependent oxidoreductase [Bacteroidota bacterium]
MKAYQLNKVGLEEPLQLIELEIPQPKENEVLIKTKFFSINPVDLKTRMGLGVYGRIKTESPLILGWDISGEVVAIGSQVNDLKVGDEVFGMVNFPGHGKVYAEYVSAPEDHLAIKPGNISHEEAAASTLAAMTAYQVFVKNLNIGDSVLIHAGAGGVGHFAIQMAKIFGAHVIATASSKNEDFVKSLGADQVIDYTQTDFTKACHDVDFVLDMMSGDVLVRSIEIVKNGGKIVSLPSGLSNEIKESGKHKNVQIDFQLVESSVADMAQIAAWLTSKKIIPHVSQNFEFNEIELAHRQVYSGKTRGKIVVSA